VEQDSKEGGRARPQQGDRQAEERWRARQPRERRSLIAEQKNQENVFSLSRGRRGGGAGGCLRRGRAGAAVPHDLDAQPEPDAAHVPDLRPPASMAPAARSRTAQFNGSSGTKGSSGRARPELRRASLSLSEAVMGPPRDLGVPREDVLQPTLQVRPDVLPRDTRPTVTRCNSFVCLVAPAP